MGKLSKRETILTEAIVCSVIFIGAKILLASILGQLGGSPYDLSAKGILANLFFILPPLAGRELVRSYILASYCHKANLKIFILVTLAMTFLSLNFSKLSYGNGMEDTAIYLATELGPKLGINIMLSYLALYGGPLAAILYIFLQEIFHWASPIISSLNWLAEGAVSILIPVASIMFIIGKYENPRSGAKAERAHKKGMKGSLGWMFTAVFSIVLLWFVVGVFPIMPSVIVTGSMEPIMYPGDVVLLKQMQKEEQLADLSQGDIIQFQRDDIRITHRIIEIIDDGLGNLTYRTKGDNNSIEDSSPVQPNDIKGTLVQVLPKIGYPTLLIKSRNSGRDDVEF